MPTDDDHDDEKVLSPDELTLDDEAVTDLGEGRYLVDTADDQSMATDDRHSWPPGSGDDAAPTPTTRTDEGGSPAPDVDRLSDADAAYGIRIAAKTRRGTAAHEVTGDDLGAVFEAALRWYAGRVDPEADPETVVETLVTAAEFDA